MPAQGNLNSFVTYNPIALPAATSFVDAIQTLAETGIHHWPVVNETRQLVGILSEQDIERTLAGRVPELVAAVGPDHGRMESLTVADAMSDVVDFVTLEETPADVLGKLLDHDLCWLPVVQDDMVIGVSTVTDFLREFSFGQFDLSKKQVSELMEPVEGIEADVSLREAWDILLDQPADCLGVMQGEFPLGVLSARDLQLAMCRVSVSAWLRDECEFFNFGCDGPQSVLELISAAPTIRPGLRLQDAATLMIDHARQAIAVVNQANRLMGAVTQDRILHRMVHLLN